ncbi:MAG TPA: glycosyltransferase family 39 protein [Terriglobales bacterium]|jgi:4-amino-4-deoxy-L-arabinose transferase-like glycosyltransferase
MSFPAKRPSRWIAAAVVVLIAIFLVELLVPARRQSQVIDEACHIYSGYSYWTKADFGLNPEHPPLVKLLAALPLLPMSLKVPVAPLPVFFKYLEFLGGKQFLYSNDADAILFRARAAVSLLAVALALLIFAAAYEMFGVTTAFIALVLCVFEPNLVAHGSFVTTDVGAAMFLYATVYAFYRYVKNPSVGRLAVVSIAAGLALAAKHSGILLCPILILLAIAETVRAAKNRERTSANIAGQIFRLAGSLLVIAIVGLGILWAAYGFRFQARPSGLALTPSLQEYAAELENPSSAKPVLLAARYHLLPEAYLYGLIDVKNAPRYLNSFLFGNLYRHGQWFYFPAVFVIKSTLGFLLLLCLLPVAVIICTRNYQREFFFLGIPAAIYFVVAMASGFNIGVRHILPVYPFLLVLAAFVAGELMHKNKVWAAVACALVLFHVVSSIRVFPNDLTYANEMWGGSAKTYKILTNSNVDWGQQLKATKKYLDQRHIQNCWFDYFSWALVDPHYYGIPCKPLPGYLSQAFDVYPPAAPAKISGTVLISADELAGEGWGPGELNPYQQFQQLRPTALIANSILVFNGAFDIPLASATSHAFAALQLLQTGQPDKALAEAQTAVAADPNSVAGQTVLCRALMQLGRKDEAHEAYVRGTNLAHAIHPEYQEYWLWLLESSGAK